MPGTLLWTSGIANRGEKLNKQQEQEQQQKQLRVPAFVDTVI